MRSLSRVTTVAALLSLATLASPSRAQEGREIARTAFPSVVLVLAENPKAHRASLGSGFFVRENLIVTNYHVIKGASRISVKLVGHKDAYRAQVVATSVAKDLALIRVIGIEAPPLSFFDLDDVSVGDQVYAVGNPEGLESTLSQGIVSGIRQIGGNRYFQISAPISDGSSGGPVLNKSGEVIGVAVGMLRSGQNLNFAIPVSEVTSLLNRTPGVETESDDDSKYFTPDNAQLEVRFVVNAKKGDLCGPRYPALFRPRLRVGLKEVI